MASTWNALGTLLNVAGMFFGGTGQKRQIILSSEKEKVILPVTPRKYSVQDGQMNKVVSVEQLGEALIFGLPAAQKISFEGFFANPDHDYPFVVGDSSSPSEMVETIKKWKEKRKPVRIIITDSPVNLMVGIMRFDWWEQDGSRDIYYSMDFTEHKDLNTPAALNDRQVDKQTGLKKRPGPSMRADGVSKIRSGSDIVDAARKAYGQCNKWRRIVKSNNLKDLAINNVGKLRRLVIK